MNILGIETSCDETAAAVVKATNNVIQVLSNVVSSQIKLHARWGGVVPNLAAREHLKNIFPVLHETLKKSEMKPENINLISITNGPGLIPALLIGTEAAKTLSLFWNKPLLGIHHIEGHIYANFIRDEISANPKSRIPNSERISKSKSQTPKIKFPVLCLVVSGGHTQLVLMKNHLQYRIIGQTLDDAAGEAFDKVARILGLEYPGGPAISVIAETFEIRDSRFEINLPRPMLNRNNFDFSFSGLKTAVLYEVKKNEKMLQDKNFIIAMSQEFQQAVIDVLISKTLKAAQEYKPRTILLAGGVSANKELRRQLTEKIEKNLPHIRFQAPEIGYSLDNAAMIAAAGYFRWKKMDSSEKDKAFSNWKHLQADAELRLK